MSESLLVILGDGPTFASAITIAKRAHPASVLRTERLMPSDIAAATMDFLDECDPAMTSVFAAIGMHALNYARFDLWAKLRLRGMRIASLIDPSAYVDPTASIGENCLIESGVSIGPNATIAAGTIIQSGVGLSADAKIGKFSWIGMNSTVGAGAAVGSHVVLGAGVHVASGVTIGAHCEIVQPGLFAKSLNEGTFISPQFTEPARVYRVAAVSPASSSNLMWQGTP